MVTQGTILSQRYLLDEELGTGGMGTVYRAVDLRTGARVAVKVPHAFLIRDRQYVERLRREAHIAASLHSSRVARVTDFAEQDGVPYLVMEFVPGESLADRIADGGALPPEDAVRVALEISRALEAANASGIVHRDLKPHNIRLTTEGDVKVLDFGIARVQGQTGLTSSSLFLGSPDYSAPERAEGEGDIRADIYSLGITLYEMLTGRLPFGSGTPWTILRRQVSEPPPPLPEGLPAMIYPIVARCLAKRPEDRYQTPQELTQDLTAAQRQMDRDRDAAGRTVTHITPAPSVDATRVLSRPDASPRPKGDQPMAPETSAAERPAADTAPPGPPPPAAPPARAGGGRGRLPVLLGGGALALVAVIVLVVVLASRGSGSSDKTPAVSPSPSPAVVAPGVTLKFTEPAEGARLPSGPVTVKVQADGLNIKAPGANDPEGRHLHYFLDLDPALVVGPGQPVPTGQANIIHTAETQFTFKDLAPGPHTVTVVVTGNDHRPLTPSIQEKVSFTVLPELTNARGGNAAPIAFQSLVSGKWSIFTVNADGRSSRRVTSTGANNLSPAWSPDGKFIAFESDREGALRIFVVNVETGEERRVSAGPGNDRTPSWSPDGKSLVFQSDRDGQKLLYVVPAEGGEVRQLTRGQRSDARPQWSPDGGLIAFYSLKDGNSRLFVVPAVGGEPREVNTGVGNDIDPAWSPDGARLAFASSREGGWNIYTVPPEGGTARRVTEGAGSVVNLSPSWSPDAKQIVFQSDREGQQNVFVIALDGGQVRRVTEGSSLNLTPVWPLR